MEYMIADGISGPIRLLFFSTCLQNLRVVVELSSFLVAEYISRGIRLVFTLAGRGAGM